MNIKNILKPATVTSIGFLVVASSYLFDITPSVSKIGWGIVIVGTVWFFLKR